MKQIEALREDVEKIKKDNIELTKELQKVLSFVRRIEVMTYEEGDVGGSSMDLSRMKSKLRQSYERNEKIVDEELEAMEKETKRR